MLILFLSLWMHASESPVFKSAKPPVLEGSYQADEKFEVSSWRRLEEVSTLSNEGQDRVSELKNQGYTCDEYKPLQVRCSYFSQSVEASEELKKFVSKKWNQKTVSFYAVLSEPRLVANTEFFKQWEVEQKAVVWKIPFETVELVSNPVTYTWTQGLERVYLGEALSNPLQLQIDSEELVVSELVTFSEGRVSDRYQVHVKFRKVQP